MNGMAFDIMWIGDREVCVWFGDSVSGWKRSMSSTDGDGESQIGTTYHY